MIRKAWKVVRNIPTTKHYCSAVITHGPFSLSYAEGKTTNSIGDNLIFCFNTREQAREFKRDYSNRTMTIFSCIGEFEKDILWRSPTDFVKWAKNTSCELSKGFYTPAGTIGFRWIKLLKESR